MFGGDRGLQPINPLKARFLPLISCSAKGRAFRMRLCENLRLEGSRIQRTLVGSEEPPGALFPRCLGLRLFPPAGAGEKSPAWHTVLSQAAWRVDVAARKHPHWSQTSSVATGPGLTVRDRLWSSSGFSGKRKESCPSPGLCQVSSPRSFRSEQGSPCGTT